MHKRSATNTAATHQLDKFAMDYTSKLVNQNRYQREDSSSPNSSLNSPPNSGSGDPPFQLSEALDLSSANRRSMVVGVEDMRKTPSPSHGSIYSEGSPSISVLSSPGKELQIGRFNLSGLNLLPRNLLTPSVSANDRMSPRQLHIKREIGDSNPLVNLHMEQSIPIPAQVLLQPGRPLNVNVNGNGGVTGSAAAAASKAARPFKAYPHDPLSLAASFTATDGLLDSQSAEKYNEFRKRMIEQIYAANGGQPTVSNPKMRRNNGFNEKKLPFENMDLLSTTCSSADSTNSTPTKRALSSPPLDVINSDGGGGGGSEQGDGKMGSGRDAAYYERRRKNNAAAKKSRDRRRIKEDEIAIRAAFLERENIELKFELATARKQLALYGISRV